jgi:hypothetical protein
MGTPNCSRSAAYASACSSAACAMPTAMAAVDSRATSHGCRDRRHSRPGGAPASVTPSKSRSTIGTARMPRVTARSPTRKPAAAGPGTAPAPSPAAWSTTTSARSPLAPSGTAPSSRQPSPPPWHARRHRLATRRIRAQGWPDLLAGGQLGPAIRPLPITAAARDQVGGRHGLRQQQRDGGLAPRDLLERGTYVGMSKPMPPSASGTSMPKKPSSASSASTPSSMAHAPRPTARCAAAARRREVAGQPADLLDLVTFRHPFS